MLILIQNQSNVLLEPKDDLLKEESLVQMT